MDCLFNRTRSLRSVAILTLKNPHKLFLVSRAQQDCKLFIHGQELDYCIKR
uniref:Uncharacterized protein n=1 Tax=Anguilla anguilla TaxID=7936 RepID=A0A0E9W3C5_ANGAN